MTTFKVGERVTVKPGSYAHQYGDFELGYGYYISEDEYGLYVNDDNQEQWDLQLEDGQPWFEHYTGDAE